MKRIAVIAALLGVSLAAGTIKQRLGQVSAGQVAECTCDVDLLEDGGPFPGGGAGEGVLNGFG